MRNLLGAPAAEAVVTAAATAECYKIVLYINFSFMITFIPQISEHKEGTLHVPRPPPLSINGNTNKWDNHLPDSI